MTKTSRRRSREQIVSSDEGLKQFTMDGNYRCPSSTFLSQKFDLNSYHRVVARKGTGKSPAKSISSLGFSHTGRKCSDLDLSVLGQSFRNYRIAVNLVLERVFSNQSYAYELGREISEYHGMMNVILKKKNHLKWGTNNDFGKLVHERMHRSVLETAARIIHSDYTRRKLVNSLLEILVVDDEHTRRLVINKRIPSDIVRLLKDTIAIKAAGDFHYALSACRQVRRVLRDELSKSFPLQENRMKLRAHELLKQSVLKNQAEGFIRNLINNWHQSGFPFEIPVFQKDTIDYSASTENATGQGYWFSPDPQRQDEIVLYIKTPPGVIGFEDDSHSPYRSHTLRLRFLNWFPRKAARARMMAEEVRFRGDLKRSVELEFRAEKYDDMNQQLYNTIQIQHVTRELAKERAQPKKNVERIDQLKALKQRLKQSRTTAPPLIKLTGNRATLIIPFMTPDEKILSETLPRIGKKSKKAGVDRGLRHSMVVSVKNGENGYSEKMIGRQELYERREHLRQKSRILMSEVTLKRNNWERKHQGLHPPAYIMKKERELEAVWQKVRRLDREISHQVAAETVWFCEHRQVKTIFFEDLRSFQGKRGMRRHSWNLSANLWGQMIEGVRYRRNTLGHRNGGICMVNPAWTSQTCHVCGERGVRVENATSIMERKGGEYFHCSKCDEYFHADVNAARNIMHVQQSKPSVVLGRTT